MLAAMLGGDTRPVVDIVRDAGGGGGGGGGGDGNCGGGGGGGVIGDEDGQLRAMCEDIVGGMGEQVALYRGGKTRLMGLFVGEVMKRSGGRANPKEAAAIMKSLLDE